MTELKCPFCGQELKELYGNGISVGFRCKNKNCPETNIMCGTKGLWQALIDTKKKLDIAVDTLKIMNDGLPNGNRWKWEIDKALEQITAPEQEDVK